MTDLFHDTINYLKDYPVNTDIDITDFLNSLSYTNLNTSDGFVTIFKTFEDLRTKHYVLPYFKNSIGQLLETNQKGQEDVSKNAHYYTNNFIAIVNITSDGKNYLKQLDRDKRQNELLNIQEKSIVSQIKLTKLALFIAGVSALATVLTLVKECIPKPLELQQETQKILEKQLTNQNSLKQSLQSIDSSFRHLVYDSSKY